MASERASVLEREASEARAALETANRLTGDVAVVEAQALGAERQLEAVREAILHGRPHRGKSGAALDAEEVRLARKETLLREKEVLLREERLVFLRKSQNARPPGFAQRRGSDGERLDYALFCACRSNYGCVCFLCPVREARCEGQIIPRQSNCPRS